MKEHTYDVFQNKHSLLWTAEVYKEDVSCPIWYKENIESKEMAESYAKQYIDFLGQLK